MSAYSIASKPDRSQFLATASESPHAEMQEVCSYHCRCAIWSNPSNACADFQISSASASYDCTSLGFMPDLRWFGFSFGNRTLPLAASGTLSPRVRAVLPAHVQRSAVQPSEAHSL